MLQWTGKPGVLLVLLLALSVPPAAALAAPDADEDVGIPGGPDFSDVTTKAAARKLVREGRLVEITLFPAELGGEEIAENISYTTPEAAEARAMVIGTLGRFFEEGLIDKLQVIPEYRGESIVPTRIIMNATHSEREGSFGGLIEVW